MSGQVQQLLARIASFGLIDPPRIPTEPTSQEAWTRLVEGVAVQRMEGLFAAAVNAGDIAVTDEQLESVRDMGRARARVDLLLERETLRVAGALREASVQHRLLKGPALAHSVYPDPSWRGFGDVDVLVRRADWDRAIDVLHQAGARRSTPEIRRGFDKRFGKDATFVTAGSWEIDLHVRLVLGPYGLWADTDTLFDRQPAEVGIGGSTLSVLDADASFVHGCYSSALADDPPRLVALRDVAQMAVGGAIDPAAVRDLARRWRGEPVVWRALVLAAETLGIDLASTTVGAFLSSPAPARSHRVLMRSYRGPARGYTAHLAGVVAVPGWLDRARYAAALAWPQRSYLEARGLLPVSRYARYVVRRVRQRS